MNRRRQALRQFGRWLVLSRRIAFDPFQVLPSLNEALDRKRIRRALTAQEVSALISAARSRPLENARDHRVNKGVTPAEENRLTQLGETRALIYAMAVGTGLRRGELSRLRWCDVDLEAGLITVPAASAKSSREQVVDLHPSLAETLRALWPADEDLASPIIPKGKFPTNRTFRRDLEAAEIDPGEPDGGVVDFHSLRKTFVTWCTANKEHPRVAQALARHASVKTTMAHYTDLRLLDTKGAVARLPVPRLTGGRTVPKLSPSTDISLHQPAVGGGERATGHLARKTQHQRTNAHPDAKKVVGAPGLEPGTVGLKGHCSTN